MVSGILSFLGVPVNYVCPFYIFPSIFIAALSLRASQTAGPLGLFVARVQRSFPHPGTLFGPIGFSGRITADAEHPQGQCDVPERAEPRNGHGHQ